MYVCINELFLMCLKLATSFQKNCSNFLASFICKMFCQLFMLNDESRTAEAGDYDFLPCCLNTRVKQMTDFTNSLFLPQDTQLERRQITRSTLWEVQCTYYSNYLLHKYYTFIIYHVK